MNSKTAIFRLTAPKEGMSDSDKIKCLAGNTGNMVFDNALGKLIDGDSIYDYSCADLSEKYDRFITTSYIWLRQNEPIHTRFSAIGDKPYIPMSVGIQAADYDSNFVIHNDVVNELKAISERCVIGCRGNYTAEILSKHGIKNTMVIGCPSMYTNMFEDWQISPKSITKPIKTASNFSTFWRKLKPFESEFLSYICDHDLSFVEQTQSLFDPAYMSDPKQSKKILAWLEKKRIFYSCEEWSEFIRSFDFSIGYRFHGNVIAVNNKVPSLFIYSDSRVREMCEFFRLPAISAREFDPSKPIEYWYERADYSEFNKTQNERIDNFKEFCRKNNIALKGENCEEKEAVNTHAPAVINSNPEEKPQFIHNSTWRHIEFEGKNLFIANGKTIWQHLKIKLPQVMRAGKEYFIKFKAKFMTSSESVRFFVQNMKGEFQQLCSAANRHTDDYYEISTCFLCDNDYDYFRVTSSDFMGENYFCISEIEISELTVKSSSNDHVVNALWTYLGIYAECSSGYGSLFEYFHDIGEKRISLYLVNQGLMKALRGMLWESGLNIYMDISQHKFSCAVGSSYYSTSLLDSILDGTKVMYDRSVPILVCCDIDELTKKKLYRLTDKVYYFYDVFRYAVVKNCILSPAYFYFKEKNLNVKITDLDMVKVSDIINPSEYEKQILTNKFEKRYDLLYDFDPEYKDKILETNGPFWRGTGKKMVYIDVATDYCIAMNGIRRTVGQPKNFQNSIWFIGVSVSSGAEFVIDEHTIESYLQQILNRELPGKYIVHNVIMPCGWHFGKFSSIVKELPIKDNDIIIFSDSFSSVLNDERFLTSQITDMAEWLNVSEYFQRPHEMGEIFVDLMHMNPRGYKRYAEAIFKELSDRNIFSDSCSEKIENVSHEAAKELDAFGDTIPEELANYIDSLKQYKKDGVNGCIVMNCNPFTLGHRYLIEYASKQVDNLYIFVVEEDKSVFKFADRLMLVKEGTKDIPNVTVIPSGKYIISALTFKAYFEKGENQDITVDTSNDLNIFGRYIAPALDISMRFAGEEPFDKITEQYNSNMRLLLPRYNISFSEIPRKENGGQVISASRVRKLLEDGALDSISELVPETTLSFLKDKFFSENTK